MSIHFIFSKVNYPEDGGYKTAQEEKCLVLTLITGKLVKALCGVMDLVAGTPRVIVVTVLVAKDGTPKIVSECDLPLTGVGVVDRVISDRAVFDVVDGALVLRQIAPGHTVAELRTQTGAAFTVAPELVSGASEELRQADAADNSSEVVGADA